jgi:hypothetical protein
LYAVALLGVLTVPVRYRGGAEVPHAHAIFQLWSDAAHGSTDHHRRWRMGEAATRPTDHVAAGHRVTAAVVAAADPDLPRLSDLTSEHERPLLILAVATLGLSVALFRSAPLWSGEPLPTGRRLRPEIPPPRFVVAPG